MDRKELIKLLQDAAETTRSYAHAIDSVLYREGSYYAGKEQATHELANKLEAAASALEDEEAEEHINTRQPCAACKAGVPCVMGCG